MDYNCSNYIKNQNIVEANLENNIILYNSETDKTYYFNELGSLIWNAIDVYDEYLQLEKNVLKQIDTNDVDTSYVICDIKHFIEKLIEIKLLKCASSQGHLT